MQVLFQRYRLSLYLLSEHLRPQPPSPEKLILDVPQPLSQCLRFKVSNLALRLQVSHPLLQIVIQLSQLIILRCEHQAIVHNRSMTTLVLLGDQ